MVQIAKPVPFWYLDRLRMYIAIDEWGCYLVLLFLYYMQWYELFAVVAVFGALCLAKAYRYYWKLQDAMCLKEAES